MELKFKSLSGSLPTYATDGASGMDLRAFIDEPVILQPMERRLIPTGLFVQIPEGYEGQVRARSGLAIKHGIGLVNSIGTIDSDYRGELKIPVINFGNESFTINNGDRIAQLVIASYERVVPIMVSDLDETDRGEGGFGHTGVKG
ncbi:MULTISPECIES: dUTP diphosphatase [Mogibacterium]|jgi:dUTP diphosphatase|uniref:dUTP diphosphatase n=1 Tax=Mogibacterium TaxID=86331 RepID=UPI00178F6E80|nr:MULTISPECIES: dUTP diphosphatase [Mogibacterium]MBB1533838.1 dUTP diphosphatase [Mogibacterium sp.]